MGYFFQRNHRNQSDLLPSLTFPRNSSQEQPFQQAKASILNSDYFDNVINRDFKITLAILIFFSKFFLFIWKSSSSWSQKSENKVSKLNPRFLKSLEGPKMNRKSLNYFSAFWPRDESYGSKTDIKTFAHEKKYFWDKMRKLQNFKKKNLITVFDISSYSTSSFIWIKKIWKKSKLQKLFWSPNI